MTKLLRDEKVLEVARKAKFHVDVPGKIYQQEEESALP
jgi:hypothetical protein